MLATLMNLPSSFCVQRKQDAALHRLQPVVQVGDRAVADDVGGVLKEILVHQPLERTVAGSLESAAGAVRRRRSRLGRGLVAVGCRLAEQRQFLLSVGHDSTSTTRWFMMYCRRSGVLRPM